MIYIAPWCREDTEALHWYHHVNAVLNNSDFKCFLKVGNEMLSLRLLGRAFHTLGAATEKARLPNSARVGNIIESVSEFGWLAYCDCYCS